MDYKIISVDSNENIETYIETLSNEEYEKIMNCISQLQSSMLAKDYYVIVADNIISILKYVLWINGAFLR